MNAGDDRLQQSFFSKQKTKTTAVHNQMHYWRWFIRPCITCLTIIIVHWREAKQFLSFFLVLHWDSDFFVGLHLFWCRRRCSHGTLAHKEFRFQFGPLSMQLEVMQIPQCNKVRVVCPKGRKRLEKLHHPSLNCTEFENHRKSLIQYCERSELLLHFE